MLRSVTFRSLLMAACTAGGLSVHGQQDPLFSQYMFNTLAFNPAYAGSADVLTVLALSRHQWVGFEGAPSTQTFVAHSPLKGENMALGFTAITDKAGPVRQTSVLGDYAYRIRVGHDSQLAFGLKGGINIYRADIASLSTVEADPANVNIEGQILPNFGFGLFWHGERYYAGLSMPKLLENDLTSVSGSALVTATEVRHVFLMGGYVFDLARDIKLKPSFLLRRVAGAPLSLDLNANFLFHERIWLGGMYRLGNSFGLLAQYQVNDQFRIGYAFDLTTTAIGAYNAGTHEIMLNYDLRFSRSKTISPRYF